MNLATQLLEIEGLGARWSLGDYESELNNPDSRSYFYRGDQGELRGFVLFREFPDGVEIMNLAVRFKGQGWGRHLFMGYLESLKNNDLVIKPLELRLEVDAENAAAIALYKKSGFEEVFRRPKYYKNGSDALLMKLIIK